MKTFPKITIRVGGSTAAYTDNTVDTVYTVYTVYTIETALHCLNCSMYACMYC